MTADRTAAPCAVPLLFFFFEKFRGTVFLDEVEVVNHTHVIPGAVPFIEVFQTPAREITALIAEPDKSEPELVAAPRHESTILTAGQAAYTVFSVKTLLLEIILLRLVTDAQRTVHPAGSNKYLFQSESPRFIFLCHFQYIRSIRFHCYFLFLSINLVE